MADGDKDYRNSGKNDNAAKTIAIIALIVGLVALFWAMKADNQASDALEKAERNASSLIESAQ